MQLFRFVFPFLYTRNWYTGAHELSRPRVVLFAGMLFLILLGILIIAFLQAPIVYDPA